MSQADVELARPDHPWLGEFERDPETAFDRIVRGIALIPPYGRADALTVIPSLFDPLDPSDPLLSLLDRAASSWIDRWRRRLPEERVDYGFKRYVRDAVTALRLPQLLALSETRAMLRDGYFQYLRWAEPLVLGTSLDPRAAFWLALAEEQPDLRFESLWQRLCRQTGERLYPPHYLSIGLLGLRRLPIRERDRLQRVLAGLAAWAAGLPAESSAKHEFRLQVRMLRWLFPLPSRSDWWEHVGPIVQAGRARPFAEWWREELGAAERSAPVSRLQEPNRVEVDQVLKPLSRGVIDAQRGRVERMIREREVWVEATGDTHHLIFTASRIASAVITRAPDLALDLSRRALVWEPNNPFLWNLWGRSLAALGRTALAEAVFWEAKRRFPDSQPQHVELGRLLAGVGRTDEAVAVFWEAVRRFPDDEPPHVELGRLLGGLGRANEALAVLREAVRRFPANDQAHVELARVMAASGEIGGAIILLRRHTESHGENPISLSVLGHFLVHADRVEEARSILGRLEELAGEQQASELRRVIARADAGEAIPVPTYRYPIGNLGSEIGAEDEELRELRVDGLVTSADFGLSPDVRPQLTRQRQQQLLQELQRVVDASPDNGYARLVWFERAEASDETRQELLYKLPRSFELRFVAALRWSDAGALNALGEEHPEQALLLRFGRMAISASDGDDRKRALRWLQQAAPPADDLVGAYLHRAVREQLTRLGIKPAKAEPDIFMEHAGSLGEIVRQAVRMIGALPVAA